MNKDTIIKDLSDELNMTQKDVRLLMDTTFDELTTLLADNKTFTKTGFGTFSVKKLDKRKGFHPMLEKWMMLPPKLKPKFKVSNILKERINNG